MIFAGTSSQLKEWFDYLIDTYGDIKVSDLSVKSVGGTYDNSRRIDISYCSSSKL